MSQAPGLKIALKRGALVAAANWPLVAIQFIAESTLKVILGVPVIGGIFLVVLLLDADVEEVLTGSASDVVGAVFGSLRANPAALTAFALAFLVVLIGGSIVTFIVKAGTVAVFVDADAGAGAIERPPLRLQMLRRANRTGIEPFLDGCRRFGPRYVRLGLVLLLVYGATAAVYLGLLMLYGSVYRMAGNVGVLLWSTVILAAASSVVLVWVTLVNFVYLLLQLIVVAEDVSVRAASGRVVRFVRASLREIAGIFGVVLVLVLLAMLSSVLATGGLSLIGFVPVFAIAVLPLQLAAWLVRGFVFQYLALTALGAYLAQYRHYLGAPAQLRGVRLQPDVIPDKRPA